MNRTSLVALNASAVSAALALAATPIHAQSLQTQSNEVADGTIVVDFNAEGDRRLGWEGINPYTPLDVDADTTPVLGIESLSMAHDSSNFYMRMFMDAFDVNEPGQSFFGAFHTIFLDTDQDRSTGYIGDDGDPTLTDGLLPIGADYLIQGPALFRFGNLGNPGGANQELFTWGGIIPFGNMIYDDDPVSDIELQIGRDQIGNPEAFDWIALTDDLSFITQDTFPNNVFAGPDEGEFFTYSTIAVSAVTGDYNDSGSVEQGDLNLVLNNWGVDTTGNIPSGWINDLPEGTVDQAELNTVLNNWGASSAPSFEASAVPEPASLAALLGALSFAGLRRRVG
ncbi:MAG: PEP-CTERM sorting domain-containing protein [Planctomycetota bacterium]